MISINLTEKKKKFTAPVVLGMDLSKIPVKKIIVVFIFTQIPLFFLGLYTNKLTSDAEDKTQALRSKEKKLRQEVRKNKKIVKQLEAYNQQIIDLKKRGEQVRQILRSRTNPRFVLEKVARAMPEKLWLEKVLINTNKEITFEGGSEDYRSIGSFIKDLNDTAYFNKRLQLEDSKTKTEKVSKREYRYESFTIKGKIDTFNPFLEGGE